MRLSRRSFVIGGAAAIAGGAFGLSLPGGGPQTFLGGRRPPLNLLPTGASAQPDELRAELTWLVSTLREVGARPFAYTDEKAFDRSVAQALASFDRPMTAAAFYLHVAPLFASLNDGHAAILYGNEFYQWYYDRRASGFPFTLTLDESGIFVDATTDQRVPRGTRIVAVDGVPADSLSHDLLALTGAQKPRLRYAFAGSQAAAYFYARYGERSHFRCDVVLPNGARRRYDVAAATLDRLQKASSSLAERSSANYTFSRIANGRVGYIDYRRCADAAAFRVFLQDTFASIKQEPVKALIIDIRRNGGGSDSLNNDLWSYAQAKPFSQGGKMTVRVSSRLKRQYGFVKYNEIYLPPSWFYPDGTNLDLDLTRVAMVTPGKNPLRYHGPVFLLIGPGTFSSAMSCALAARDYGLATLIGEETGEPANSTGEVYSGFSPRVGVQFNFTTKYFWAPKPRPDGQGVLPDVRIVPTEDDLRTGRDPVLAYAIKAATGTG